MEPHPPQLGTRQAKPTRGKATHASAPRPRGGTDVVWPEAVFCGGMIQIEFNVSRRIDPNADPNLVSPHRQGATHEIAN